MDVNNLLPFKNEELLDPTINFNTIPSIPSLKKLNEVYQDQKEQKNILQKNFKKKEKWYSKWLTQGILAIISSIIIALLLFIINPPITQKFNKDENISEKQDWKKVLIMCVIVFLLVLLLPEIIRLTNILIYKKK